MNHTNVPIEVGEIVFIRDGSYMLTVDIVNNKLSHWSKNNSIIGHCKHAFIVIAVNVPCPNEEEILKSLRPSNNCIIKDMVTNEIWFCSEINLKTERSLF